MLTILKSRAMIQKSAAYDIIGLSCVVHTYGLQAYVVPTITANAQYIHQYYVVYYDILTAPGLQSALCLPPTSRSHSP